MKTPLLRAGAIAGTKKQSRLFSTPMARAATEMKTRKGNMRRVSDMAARVPSASKPGAITLTRTGAATMPAAVTRMVAARSTDMICLARERAEAGPSFARVLVNSGTKAAERAPSASSLLERFASV